MPGTGICPPQENSGKFNSPPGRKSQTLCHKTPPRTRQHDGLIGVEWHRETPRSSSRLRAREAGESIGFARGRHALRRARRRGRVPTRREIVSEHPRPEPERGGRTEDFRHGSMPRASIDATGCVRGCRCACSGLGPPRMSRRHPRVRPDGERQNTFPAQPRRRRRGRPGAEARGGLVHPYRRGLDARVRRGDSDGADLQRDGHGSAQTERPQARSGKLRAMFEGVSEKVIRGWRLGAAGLHVAQMQIARASAGLLSAGKERAGLRRDDDEQALLEVPLRAPAQGQPRPSARHHHRDGSTQLQRIQANFGAFTTPRLAHGG